MGLIAFLNEKKQRADVRWLHENARYGYSWWDVRLDYKIIKDICDSGSPGDQLVTGYGEFGLTATNPIPTNTIFGVRFYLALLCTADGERVTSEHIGTTHSEVSKMPIDVYATSRADGTPLPTIFISQYQRDNSRKAPRGFRLLLSDRD